MKYFISFIICVALCGCGGANKKTNTAAADFTVTKNFSQSARGKETPPPHTDRGLIIIGQNLVLNFTEHSNELLALYISITNPESAKNAIIFDTPTRINVSAVWPDGTETLLHLLTGSEVDESLAKQSRVFLRPARLEPGQSISGVLFLANKHAPQYHLSLVNENEVFDFYFKKNK